MEVLCVWRNRCRPFEISSRRDNKKKASCNLCNDSVSLYERCTINLSKLKVIMELFQSYEYI